MSFISYLINGLSLGSVYAIIALGYTMVYDRGYYDALLKWCKDRYDWSFDEEQIVFSPGVIPALYQLVEDLVGKNEKVLTMTPAYGFFLHACEYNGVELVTSPLKRENGRFEIDFDDLEKKASEPEVKMLMCRLPVSEKSRCAHPRGAVRGDVFAGGRSVGPLSKTFKATPRNSRLAP